VLSSRKLLGSGCIMRNYIILGTSHCRILAQFHTTPCHAMQLTVCVSTIPSIGAQPRPSAHMYPPTTQSLGAYAVSHARQSLERGSCCKGAGWAADIDQGCMRHVINGAVAISMFSLNRPYHVACFISLCQGNHCGEQSSRNAEGRKQKCQRKQKY
jgi:hypothetical protein